MDKFTKEYTTFYQQKNPDPYEQLMAIHISPFQISDKVPIEAEVEASVQCLIPHKASRHTHLCMEHFKTWLREGLSRRGGDPPPPQI